MNDIIFRVIVPDNKILFKTLMLKGERGDDGVSIVSFEKTQTIGLTDYYTITLNDGTTYEFTVQNGTNSYYDDELSLASENAVQNKIITAAINSINAALASIQQYDNALSSSSENAVQNKVVKSAIDSIISAIALLAQYDSALSGSSENAVQNKVVKAALDLKANLSALANYYNKTEVNALFNGLGASGVSYNNASSGLSATDTQAAIDELVQGGAVSRPTVVATTGNTMSYNNSVKYGKMVSVTVTIRVASAPANTHTHIGTVTEKPIDTTVAVPSVNGQNGTYGGMITISSSNGNIYLYSPTALTNVNVGFTATYYQA